MGHLLLPSQIQGSGLKAEYLRLELVQLGYGMLALEALANLLCYNTRPAILLVYKMDLTDSKWNTVVTGSQTGFVCVVD